MEPTTTKTFTIAGITYRLEPLSFQQSWWLGHHIFKDVDIRTLNYGAIWDYGREHGPLMMAICLLAEGQTRADKSRMPFSAIEALATVFQGDVTGSEVAEFCTAFFFACRPHANPMLVPGTLMQALVEAEVSASSPAPGENGSNAAWSSSVTGM